MGNAAQYSATIYLVSVLGAALLPGLCVVLAEWIKRRKGSFFDQDETPFPSKADQSRLSHLATDVSELGTAIEGIDSKLDRITQSIYERMGRLETKLERNNETAHGAWNWMRDRYEAWRDRL